MFDACLNIIEHTGKDRKDEMSKSSKSSRETDREREREMWWWPETLNRNKCIYSCMLDSRTDMKIHVHEQLET